MTKPVSPVSEGKLLPCAHCGSKLITIRYEGQPAMRYAFMCQDCGSTVNAVYVGGTMSGSTILFNNPDAIAAWNRRSPAASGAAPEWISVKDRLPEVGQLVMVYAPPTKEDWPDSVRISFDCIDPDADDPTYWMNHGAHYEHYCCVAKPEGSVGPSEKAPYTHWQPLPASTEDGRGAEV